MRNKYFLTPIFIGLIVSAIPFYILPALAASRTSPYLPGETLNPDCSPTDTNCTVSKPVTYDTTDINVPIGTSTAASLLELYSVSVSPILTITAATPTASYDPYLQFRTGAAPSTKFVLGVDYSDSNKFKIATSSIGTNDILVIDQNGNVGIGTSTPAYKLDVVGDLRVTASSTLGNVISGVWQGTAITDAYIANDITLTDITQITNRSILDTSETLTVARGGTGITTAPSAHGQLLMASSTGWVVGNLLAGANMTITTSTPGQITFTSTGGGGGGVATTTPFSAGYIPYATSSSAITNSNIFQLGDNIGIGTTDPQKKLDVLYADSSAQLRLSQSTSIYAEFYINSVGDLRISATGGDIRISDENLWVCLDGSCAISTTTDKGNVVVETAFMFDNNFKFKKVSATTTALYDSTTSTDPIIIFDELE